MKIKKTLAALFMLPLLCACQSESYQKSFSHDALLKVGAYLPNSNDTRAQIKYGSGVEETGETFMWNKKDYITLFNVTKSADYPSRVELEEINISSDGKRAEFESVESVDSALIVEKGDVILVLYGEAGRYKEGTIKGLEDVFEYSVGTEANKPQYIEENPDDESLSYMKDNLKMYDVVKVDDNGQIPDLHFKHLSALMRVTLRNETGGYIYPTKLEFKYPGTESFFNTTLYFSVNDDMSLNVYEDEGVFYGGSKVYTDNIGTTINGKDKTDDAGDSIADGESYELYISTVPRIGNKREGKSFEIHLIVNHDTDNPYVITFDDFNTVIEAGKRYWFDLTATPDGKLMLTSEWNEQQNGQGTTPPEEDNNNKDEEGDNQGGGDTSETNE